jgi:predicted Zn-dependent protease
MSTHPPSEERVQQMKELAAQSPDKKAITNTADFTRAKQVAVALRKK